MAFIDLYFLDNGDIITENTSFLKDVFIQLIGTGGALWIFFCGIKYERKKELKRKRDERLEKLKFFSALASSTLKTVKSQYNHYQKFIKEIDNNPFEIELMGYTISEDIRRVVQNFNTEEYFLAFLEKYNEDESKNVNQFKDIYSCYDFFHNQFNQVKEIVKSSVTADFEKKKDFKLIAESSLGHIFSLLQKEDFKNDKVSWEELNSTMINFIKNDTGTIKYWHDYLLIPAKKILVNKSSNSEVQSILTLLQQATFIYNEIPLQNKMLRENIYNISISLNEVINKFELTTKELRELVNVSN